MLPTPAAALAEQRGERPALSRPPPPRLPLLLLPLARLGPQSQSLKGTSWAAGPWTASFVWPGLNSLLLLRVHATEAEGGEGVMAPEKQPGRRTERRGAGEGWSLGRAPPPSPAPCPPSLPARPPAAHRQAPGHVFVRPAFHGVLLPCVCPTCWGFLALFSSPPTLSSNYLWTGITSWSCLAF